MAYVLSLSPSNPLDRPFAEPPNFCNRSRASITSQISAGTIRHIRQRSQTMPWPLPDDTSRLESSRLASRTVLNYIRDFDRASEPPPTPDRDSSVYELAREEIEHVAELESDLLTADSVKQSEDSIVPFPPLEPLVGAAASDRDDHIALAIPESSPAHASVNSSPFKRWLRTLRRRNDLAAHPITAVGATHPQSPRSGHNRSLSLSSSMGILTGVKSATLTLAGTSIAPTSRYGRQGILHSDNTSHREPRLSVDSASPSVEATIDGKAWYRSVQRRNIVEEIVQSEESYISDMKAMVHVGLSLIESIET